VGATLADSSCLFRNLAVVLLSFRPLGQSGLRSFPIAYGMWRFAGTDVATARRKVEVERLARTALRRATVGLDPQCAPWGTPD